MQYFIVHNIAEFAIFWHYYSCRKNLYFSNCSFDTIFVVL